MPSEKDVDDEDQRKSLLAESSLKTSPIGNNEQRDRLEVLDEVLKRVRFGAHLDDETRRSICAVTPNAGANVHPASATYGLRLWSAGRYLRGRLCTEKVTMRTVSISSAQERWRFP